MLIFELLKSPEAFIYTYKIIKFNAFGHLTHLNPASATSLFISVK